jgi:transitional endoplasmic reticulum ATPase
MPLASDVDLDEIAADTTRFTGADLEDLVRRAGLNALRESLNVKEVTMAHFRAAREDTRATVTEQMEAEYAAMEATIRQKALETNPLGFSIPLLASGVKANRN